MEADIGQARQAIIYGADSRREPFEDGDLARSRVARERAVALIAGRDVLDRGGRVELDVPTAGEAFGLCEGERFTRQPSAAFCSGALVEEDLVLTAGHCALLWPCSEFRVVRGYEMENERDPREIDAANVARCLGVTRDDDPVVDLAWIRLDRALPLSARPASPSRDVVRGEAVTLAGNALGLPTKIDAGGSVVEPRAGDGLFTASVDNFVGGSGSAVLAGDGELLGVATSGAADFVDAPGGCRKARVLAPGDGSERIFALARALEISRDVLPERRPPDGASCTLSRPRSIPFEDVERSGTRWLATGLTAVAALWGRATRRRSASRNDA